MTHRHEILYLNPNRTYVRVGNTWYDCTTSFEYAVGDPFLVGKIEEVLSYEQYKKHYPESKNEMGPKVSDKTNSGGYIRKVSTKPDEQGKYNSITEYAINLQQFQIKNITKDLSD